MKKIEYMALLHSSTHREGLIPEGGNMARKKLSAGDSAAYCRAG
jgi:hypothetical protein